MKIEARYSHNTFILTDKVPVKAPVKVVKVIEQVVDGAKFLSLTLLAFGRETYKIVVPEREQLTKVF